MGFSIDRRAHKPRGLFRKAPDPREVGERLTRLVKRIERDRVLRIARKQERLLVELELHPAAPPFVLLLDRDGSISVRGETGTIGPGYHAEVVARVARILDEIDYVWAAPEPEPEPAMCAWLATELAGTGQIRIGVPAERSFITDAPILTALGPRDEAWRARVLAKPGEGADAFPWWQRGRAGAARSRALLAMWLEVAWRVPIYPDEIALLERVDADLREARTADPAIDLPYAAWAELLELLERDAPEVAAIRARGGAGADAAPIGYRRLDMEVELGGWSLQLPGAFTGLWIDDGARYWASDGDRVVELTTFTAAGETDSERLLAVAAPVHPVVDQFVDGARRGRAEAHDQGDVHVVTGLVASAPHVAILTFKIEQRDQAWALATWRTLRSA